jgi:hypothetical protein
MLAGETHHGAIGQAGDAQAGHRVGETAAGSHAAHTWGAGDPGPAVGGISGRLLMAHVDELDAVVHQISENGKRVPTVDGEQVLHVLFLQNAADERAAIKGCHQ